MTQMTSEVSTANKCITSDEEIKCNNIDEINKRCISKPLKELMKFYITKDGCQSGTFGSVRQQRSIIISETSYEFYGKRFLSFSNDPGIKFNNTRLKKGLELISEKTPFVSGDQLRIMIDIINNIRLPSNNSLINSKTFKKEVLSVLLIKHIIGKISKEDYAGIRILNTLYQEFYYKKKQIYFNGHPYKIVWTENPNLLDVFFALYNYISSGVYQSIDLNIPNDTNLNNMNLLPSGEVTIKNLFSSYENVLSFFIYRGYVQLDEIPGHFYTDALPGFSNPISGGKKSSSKKNKIALSEKTVDQLRSMMKKHGKKCSKDGKRLTKDQMIRVLKRC